MRPHLRAAALLGVVALLSGLLALPASPASADVTLPPVGTDFDYQLGGNRSVPDRVGVVIRDREAEPLEGVYSMCYVNGFQTQPHEKKFWKKRMRLVLHDDGKPVVDSGWGEWVLDIRTRAKRTKLAAIMGTWVQGCADDGYAAVDFDNLDSFYRGHGLIKRKHSRAYARLLADEAHARDLAAGQKNWSEWDGSDVFDFAISEDCARFKECGSYVDSYGSLVFDVEYGRKAFRRACRQWDDTIAVVRRDKALSDDGLRRYC